MSHYSEQFLASHHNYFCQFHQLYGAEADYAKAGMTWLNNNGEAICCRKHAAKQLKAHIRAEYGIGPFAISLLWFVIPKIIEFLMKYWWGVTQLPGLNPEPPKQSH